MDFGIGSIADLIKTGIDKIWPDAGEEQKIELSKAELKANLQIALQKGDLEELKQTMEVMLAEAQSKDPWTSRARPTFLYVIYVFILASIPMGVLSYFNPDAAVAVATGAREWLKAIPGELYTLFGAGYLGYNVSRTFDKKTIVKNMRGLGK